MKHYIINDTILPKGSPAREVHRDVSLIDKLVKTEHDFHFPGSPQITLPIPSDVEGSKMELTHVLIDGIQPLYHFTEHVFFNPSKPGQVPSIRARSIWSVFKFESMRYKQGNVILADPTPVSNGFERMLKKVLIIHIKKLEIKLVIKTWCLDIYMTYAQIILQI